MFFMNTTMGDVTLFYTLFELSIFIYLIFYQLSRPENKMIKYNLFLVGALITYNIIAGLLRCGQNAAKPDWQVLVSYGVGFLTPCYFPYYIYKFFNLEKMRFHAKRGSLIFLAGSYGCFAIIYLLTHSIIDAQYILIIPLSYGIWICVDIVRSVNFKFKKIINPQRQREELIILLLSFTPWIGLTLVSFFNLSQNMDALTTNTGIIILLLYNLNKHIRLLRLERIKLVLSEKRLMSWNVELKAEVEKKVKEINKIHEEKINAFIHIAHETKTPLTLINNYLDDYLERNIETEEISAMKSGLKKMIKDVNNLFDLEKSGKGKSLYDHSRTTDLSQTLNSCLKIEAATCKKKNIRLVSVIQPDLYTSADEAALRRIIINLLSNAIKFTDPKGKITVELLTEDKRIVLRVRDTGIGIEQAQRANVFMPYYQIRQAKKVSEGMGLGLPIVKQILSEIEANIQIKDNVEDGVGTSVEVTLPCSGCREKYSNDFAEISQDITHEIISDIAEDQPEGGHEIMKDKNLNNSCTLVLIEDNPSLGGYLRDKLSDQFNVNLFQTAEAAINYLSDSPTRPDLILSDVMLPGIDGITFGSRIMNDKNLEDIPVVFMSANSTTESIESGLMAGAVDYIIKPFSFRELRLKISSIIASRNNCAHHIISAACNNLLQLKNQDAVDMHFEEGGGGTNNVIPKEVFHLTSREMEVIRFLKKGKTYSQIGDELFISPKTVGKHIENIYAKVEVDNKISLLDKIYPAK